MGIFKDGDANGESDDDVAVATIICGGLLRHEKQMEKPVLSGSRPGRSGNLHRDFQMSRSAD